MITPDVLTEYVRMTMPDAAVTVSDRTRTMNHLKVVVTSAAFRREEFAGSASNDVPGIGCPEQERQAVSSLSKSQPKPPIFRRLTHGRSHSGRN